MTKETLRQLAWDAARTRAERQAQADLREYLGRVIRVSWCRGEGPREKEDFSGRLGLWRVLGSHDLANFVTGGSRYAYLDPQWAIEPLEPEPRFRGFEVFWTFGPCYLVQAETGVIALQQVYGCWTVDAETENLTAAANRDTMCEPEIASKGGH